MPHTNPMFKEQRKTSAKERNARWQSLTLREQLDDLDLRLGKDVGATKQREKIKAWIEAGHTYNPSKEKKHVKDDNKQAPGITESIKGEKERPFKPHVRKFKKNKVLGKHGKG